MQVVVHFEAQLRQLAEVDNAVVSIPDASSVLDLLRVLAEQVGTSLRDRVFHADGTVQRSVLLFVNDRSVAHDALDRCHLKDGDSVLLYPPISGG